MERTYIALVHKDLDSDYGVSFPDLPGCITVGSTLEEAHEMAREALALHLEGLGADGDAVPPPGSADQALVHEDAFDAIALIVVEALPERTEEEARAEFEAFLASDEYQEIYGHPLTEDELDDLPDCKEPISEALAYGIGLRPVTGAGAKWIYAALVHEDPDRNFSVSFPDLPGCIAAGSVLKEACITARESLALDLQEMAAHGISIPTPSSANSIMDRLDATDAVALVVVEALPERTDVEAHAEFETILAPDEYREIYGEVEGGHPDIDIPSGTFRSLERQTGVKLQ